MKTMLNVALPKGRLGEKVYDLFERAGFDCPSIKEKGRKLIFENPEAGVRYFWVKPSDVALNGEPPTSELPARTSSLSMSLMFTSFTI